MLSLADSLVVAQTTDMRADHPQWIDSRLYISRVGGASVVNAVLWFVSMFGHPPNGPPDDPPNGRNVALLDERVVTPMGSDMHSVSYTRGAPQRSIS